MRLACCGFLLTVGDLVKVKRSLQWKPSLGAPGTSWELVRTRRLEDVTPELYFGREVELGEISAEQNLGN